MKIMIATSCLDLVGRIRRAWSRWTLSDVEYLERELRRFERLQRKSGGYDRDLERIRRDLDTARARDRARN